MLKAEEKAIRWAIRGRNVLKSGKVDQRACTYGYLCFGWCLAGLTEKVLNLLFFTKSPVNCPTVGHVEVPLPQTLPRKNYQENTEKK